MKCEQKGLGFIEFLTLNRSISMLILARMTLIIQKLTSTTSHIITFIYSLKLTFTGTPRTTYPINIAKEERIRIEPKSLFR